MKEKTGKNHWYQKWWSVYLLQISLWKQCIRLSFKKINSADALLNSKTLGWTGEEKVQCWLVLWEKQNCTSYFWRSHTVFVLLVELTILTGVYYTPAASDCSATSERFRKLSRFSKLSLTAAKSRITPLKIESPAVTYWLRDYSVKCWSFPFSLCSLKKATVLMSALNVQGPTCYFMMLHVCLEQLQKIQVDS